MPQATNQNQARSEKSLFTIKNLSFAYPKRADHKKSEVSIFKDFNLVFHEGIVTSVLGANGSGKTTLFDLMSKNLVPTSGTISLRGVDITRLRLKDYAQLVAIVHQHNRAPRDVSVRELVAYGRNPHHGALQSHSKESVEHDSKLVDKALSLCGMADLAQAPITALSGGQAQRAWIAMALAQDTKVLLLDEPTTYLDVRYQLELLKLIQNLNKELGISVIMVIHDVNQAIHYSDELVGLSCGMLACQGDPKEVVTPELMKKIYGIDLKVTEIAQKPFVLAV